MLRKMINKVRMSKVNASWENRRKYLIGKGAKIGKGTRLNCTVDSFGSEPYLIEIGENCLFAEDIQLINHDGGVKVLNALGYFDGQRMDKLGKITIGNNVYIGMGAYVMPGVTIGNNCIIGAKALVTRSVPENSVAVGVPAKVIKNIDEYYEKSKNKFYQTAGMSSEEKRAFCEKNALN